MNRITLHRIIGAGATLALVATGCSGEDATESIIEQAIENESGEDVDIDFGDGGFSVESEDGSFSLDEDGNLVIIGEDGEEITGTFDDEGFTIEGEDGEEITGSFDDGGGDDGSFTLETDEGTITAGSATEVPDTWPPVVPVPTEFPIETASSFTSGDQLNVTVGGNSPDGPAAVEAYSAKLLAAGFENQSTFTSNDSSNSSFVQGDLTVSVSAFNNGDGTWLTSVVVLGTTG